MEKDIRQIQNNGNQDLPVQGMTVHETATNPERKPGIKPGDLRLLIPTDDFLSDELSELVYSDEYPYQNLKGQPLILVTSIDPDTRSANIVMVSEKMDEFFIDGLFTDRDFYVNATDRIYTLTDDHIEDDAFYDENTEESDSGLFVHTDLYFEHVGLEDLNIETYGNVSDEDLRKIKEIINNQTRSTIFLPTTEEQDPRKTFRELQARVIREITQASRDRVQEERESRGSSIDIDS